MQPDKSLLTREETNRLIGTKRRERKEKKKVQKKSAPFSKVVLTGIEEEKNSNMIQRSGMLTDVESARLLGCCSLNAGQEFYSAGGRRRSRLRPPLCLQSLRSWKVSVLIGCSDESLQNEGAGGASTHRGEELVMRGRGQRSSERFWMASATAVRSRAMTERGSSLPITALPDTIMLAPACGGGASGKWIAAQTKKGDSHLIRFSYLGAFINGVGSDTSVHFDV